MAKWDDFKISNGGRSAQRAGQSGVRNATPRAERIAARMSAASAPVGPKRGEALFEGTSYPRSWDDYIGQDKAVGYIQAACTSAKARGARLEHTLIATGVAGAGKTSIARLIASEMGVGLVEVQGAISADEFLRMVAGLSDGDIFFWDEIHQAVSKGLSKAEWLLPVLQDGVLITSKGTTAIPNITFIGATTDAAKLPETILSRFVIKPIMEEYSDDQAMHIAHVAAKKVFAGLDYEVPGPETCMAVSAAANNNPRVITSLLKVLRDCVLSGNSDLVDGEYDMSAVYEWSGISQDGLDKMAQDYLETLFVQFDGKAGEKTMAAALGEPTTPRHTEKLLVQRGYIQVAPGGRELTADGIERARYVLKDRGF